MTSAASDGRRTASSGLTNSVENLLQRCNLNATDDRLCPLDCIQSHTDLDLKGNQPATRCTLCGMRVDLAVWNRNLMEGSRPWSRWHL